MNAEKQGIIDIIEIYREHFEALKKKGVEQLPIDEVIKEFTTLEKVANK